MREATSFQGPDGPGVTAEHGGSRALQDKKHSKAFWVSAVPWAEDMHNVWLQFFHCQDTVTTDVSSVLLY